MFEPVNQIKTNRLMLRQWQKSDRKPFAQLNADPAVMKYYPNTLNREQSDAMFDKLSNIIVRQGWGFWAVELLDEEQFIGFVGLHKPDYNLPVSPCTEVGWRLAKEYWGNGYATEAANAALNFAFTQLDLSEVYSFTSIINQRSERLMQRLGLINTHNNFNHPMILNNLRLREHVLYCAYKDQYLSSVAN